MTERPLARDRLVGGRGGPRRAAAVVEAVAGDADTARALWAFAHGMTILELNGRFPAGADLDAAWVKGVEAFRPRIIGRMRRFNIFSGEPRVDRTRPTRTATAAGMAALRPAARGEGKSGASAVYELPAGQSILPVPLRVRRGGVG